MRESFVQESQRKIRRGVIIATIGGGICAGGIYDFHTYTIPMVEVWAQARKEAESKFPPVVPQEDLDNARMFEFRQITKVDDLMAKGDFVGAKASIDLEGIDKSRVIVRDENIRVARYREYLGDKGLSADLSLGGFRMIASIIGSFVGVGVLLDGLGELEIGLFLRSGRRQSYLRDWLDS